MERTPSEKPFSEVARRKYLTNPYTYGIMAVRFFSQKDKICPPKTPSTVRLRDDYIAKTVIGAGARQPDRHIRRMVYLLLAVLLYTWFSMLSSGLMILEVNTHYPHGAS